MKISKYFSGKIAFIINITLLVLFVLFTFLLVSNQRKLLQSQKMGYESNKIAYELKTSSEDLTKFVRMYVVTGDPKYKKAFWHILDVRNGKAPRPDGRTVPFKTLMKQLGFTEEEFKKLEQAQNNSDKLVEKESVAMNAIKGVVSSETLAMKKPDESMRDFAVRIVHDETYHRDKATIMNPIDEFIELVDKRVQSQNEHYNHLSIIYILVDSLVILALIVSLLTLLINMNQSLKREKEFSNKLYEKQREILELIETINQKNIFVAGLTHDLRSPICSEQKALEAILSKKFGTELGGYYETLQDIYKTNEELLFMVNNYLSLFHYESEKIELNIKKHNIEDLINASVRSVIYLARDQGSDIDVNIQDELPLIEVDKDQIISVLVNLISNAIKHNRKGTAINISAMQVENTVELSVNDNGEGIPEDEQEGIFQRFPTQKRKIGTGLGLYLSRQIVEAHNGKIWFESEEGKGTTFTFSLPVQP